MADYLKMVIAAVICVSLICGILPREGAGKYAGFAAGLIVIAIVVSPLFKLSGSLNLQLSDIETCGMDYVALGHVHAASGLKVRGACFYAYPGCPEGRGFDETGEKGVLALTVSKGHVTAEFVPVQQRMYVSTSIDVSKAECMEDIAKQLNGALKEPQNMYRFRLTGSSSFPIDTEVLKSGIDAFDVSVIDETVPAVDLEQLSREFSLKGLFTKFALEDRANMEAEAFELAFKTGFSILEKEERNEN